MAAWLILLALAAALVFTLVRSRFWPYGRCPACRRRKGRGIGSTDQAARADLAAAPGGGQGCGPQAQEGQEQALTTPRRERRGSRPSQAGVPVSPPTAQRVNPVSYASSAGIGARFSTYGTTCRIFRTCPSYLRTGGN